MTSVCVRRFVDKVAVVTGGDGCIGAAVAARLAAEGAAVVVGYRGDQQAADELVATLAAAGGRALAVCADIADPEETKALMERAVSEFGQLDVLVSCAGIEHFDALENISPTDFDRVFAVNTRGQLFAVQHAAPHMRTGGRIVLTSSVSACRAVFGHTLYAASRAALESIVLNVSAELSQEGITINALVPGGTATGVAAEHDAGPTQPEEIAAGYAFLASDDAAYMTGRTLQGDGGFF